MIKFLVFTLIFLAGSSTLFEAQANVPTEAEIHFQTVSTPKTIVIPGSAVDITLDDMSLSGLQLQSVITDMYRYIGWDKDNKEGMKKESQIALRRLTDIKDRLSHLDTPL